MVRETRHLWIGNLPINICEEKINDHFKRYGKVQSVKILGRNGKSDENNSGSGNGNINTNINNIGNQQNNNINSICATVAFIDIRSAAKAHNSENKIEERTLLTDYYEPPASSTSSSAIYIHEREDALLNQRPSGNTVQYTNNGGNTRSQRHPATRGLPEDRYDRERLSASYERLMVDRESYVKRNINYHDDNDYTNRNRSRERNYPRNIANASSYSDTIERNQSHFRLYNRGGSQSHFESPRYPSNELLEENSSQQSQRNLTSSSSSSSSRNRLTPTVNSNLIGVTSTVVSPPLSLSSFQHNKSLKKKHKKHTSRHSLRSQSASPSPSRSRSTSLSSDRSHSSSSSSNLSSDSESNLSESPISYGNRKTTSHSGDKCNTNSTISSGLVATTNSISSLITQGSNHTPQHISSATPSSDCSVIDKDDTKPVAICVRNLPARSTDTSLKDGLFHEYKKHGKVTMVKVIGQGIDRFAVVCFKKSEDVEKALEVSKDKLFFGCKIEVTPHEGIDAEDNDFRPLEAELDEYHPKATKTLFVGNLEKDTSTSDLRSHFEQFGEIIEIDIKKQGTSTYAFIQYSDITSVVKAMRKLDGENLGANRIKLGFGKSMPTTCIWLNSIPEAQTEKTLMRQCSRFGPIVNLIMNREKGNCLIFYENVECAQLAVTDLKNRLVNGRKLEVDFANRECQKSFYEKLELTSGQSLNSDRSWERRTNCVNTITNNNGLCINSNNNNNNNNSWSDIEESRTPNYDASHTRNYQRYDLQQRTGGRNCYRSITQSPPLQRTSTSTISDSRNRGLRYADFTERRHRNFDQDIDYQDDECFVDDSRDFNYQRDRNRNDYGDIRSRNFSPLRNSNDSCESPIDISRHQDNFFSSNKDKLDERSNRRESTENLYDWKSPDVIERNICKIRYKQRSIDGDSHDRLSPLMKRNSQSMSPPPITPQTGTSVNTTITTTITTTSTTTTTTTSSSFNELSKKEKRSNSTCLNNKTPRSPTSSSTSSIVNSPVKSDLNEFDVMSEKELLNNNLSQKWQRRPSSDKIDSTCLKDNISADTIVEAMDTLNDNVKRKIITSDIEKNEISPETIGHLERKKRLLAFIPLNTHRENKLNTSSSSHLNENDVKVRSASIGEVPIIDNLKSELNEISKKRSSSTSVGSADIKLLEKNKVHILNLIEQLSSAAASTTTTTLSDNIIESVNVLTNEISSDLITSKQRKYPNNRCSKNFHNAKETSAIPLKIVDATTSLVNKDLPDPRKQLLSDADKSVKLKKLERCDAYNGSIDEFNIHRVSSTEAINNQEYVHSTTTKENEQGSSEVSSSSDKVASIKRSPSQQSVSNENVMFLIIPEFALNIYGLNKTISTSLSCSQSVVSTITTITTTLTTTTPSLILTTCNSGSQPISHSSPKSTSIMSPLSNFSPNTVTKRSREKSIDSKNEVTTTEINSTLISQNDTKIVTAVAASVNNSKPNLKSDSLIQQELETNKTCNNSNKMSIEDRIRALDAKYNQWSGSSSSNKNEGPLTTATSSAPVIDYSKYHIKKKSQVNVSSSTNSQRAEPSDIVKSLLSKSSIFDQDTKRLEHINEKYEPKDVNNETSVSQVKPIFRTKAAAKEFSTQPSLEPIHIAGSSDKIHVTESQTKTTSSSVTTTTLTSHQESHLLTRKLSEPTKTNLNKKDTISNTPITPQSAPPRTNSFNAFSSLRNTSGSTRPPLSSSLSTPTQTNTINIKKEPSSGLNNSSNVNISASATTSTNSCLNKDPRRDVRQVIKKENPSIHSFNSNSSKEIVVKKENSSSLCISSSIPGATETKTTTSSNVNKSDNSFNKSSQFSVGNFNAHTKSQTGLQSTKKNDSLTTSHINNRKHSHHDTQENESDKNNKSLDITVTTSSSSSSSSLCSTKTSQVMKENKLGNTSDSKNKHNIMGNKEGIDVQKKKDKDNKKIYNDINGSKEKTSDSIKNKDDKKILQHYSSKKEFKEKMKAKSEMKSTRRNIDSDVQQRHKGDKHQQKHIDKDNVEKLMKKDKTKEKSNNKEKKEKTKEEKEIDRANKALKAEMRKLGVNLDEEPVYFSMYDKVKARSSHNQSLKEAKDMESMRQKFNQLKQCRAKRDDSSSGKKDNSQMDTDSDSDLDKSNSSKTKSLKHTSSSLTRKRKMVIESSSSSSDDDDQQGENIESNNSSHRSKKRGFKKTGSGSNISNSNTTKIVSSTHHDDDGDDEDEAPKMITNKKKSRKSFNNNPFDSDSESDLERFFTPLSKTSTIKKSKEKIYTSDSDSSGLNIGPMMSPKIKNTSMTNKHILVCGGDSTVDEEENNNSSTMKNKQLKSDNRKKESTPVNTSVATLPSSSSSISSLATLTSASVNSVARKKLLKDKDKDKDKNKDKFKEEKGTVKTPCEINKNKEELIKDKEILKKKSNDKLHKKKNKMKKEKGRIDEKNSSGTAIINKVAEKDDAFSDSVALGSGVIEVGGNEMKKVDERLKEKKRANEDSDGSKEMVHHRKKKKKTSKVGKIKEKDKKNKEKTFDSNKEKHHHHHHHRHHPSNTPPIHNRDDSSFIKVESEHETKSDLSDFELALRKIDNLVRQATDSEPETRVTVLKCGSDSRYSGICSSTTIKTEKSAITEDELNFNDGENNNLNYSSSSSIFESHKNKEKLNENNKINKVSKRPRKESTNTNDDTKCNQIKEEKQRHIEEKNIKDLQKLSETKDKNSKSSNNTTTSVIGSSSSGHIKCPITKHNMKDEKINRDKDDRDDNKVKKLFEKTKQDENRKKSKKLLKESDKSIMHTIVRDVEKEIANEKVMNALIKNKLTKNKDEQIKEIVKQESTSPIIANSSTISDLVNTPKRSSSLSSTSSSASSSSSSSSSSDEVQIDDDVKEKAKLVEDSLLKEINDEINLTNSKSLNPNVTVTSNQISNIMNIPTVPATTPVSIKEEKVHRQYEIEAAIESQRLEEELMSGDSWKHLKESKGIFDEIVIDSVGNKNELIEDEKLKSNEIRYCVSETKSNLFVNENELEFTANSSNTSSLDVNNSSLVTPIDDVNNEIEGLKVNEEIDQRKIEDDLAVSALLQEMNVVTPDPNKENDTEYIDRMPETQNVVDVNNDQNHNEHVHDLDEMEYLSMLPDEDAPLQIDEQSNDSEPHLEVDLMSQNELEIDNNSESLQEEAKVIDSKEVIIAAAELPSPLIATSIPVTESVDTNAYTNIIDHMQENVVNDSTVEFHQNELEQNLNIVSKDSEIDTTNKTENFDIKDENLVVEKSINNQCVSQISNIEESLSSLHYLSEDRNDLIIDDKEDDEGELKIDEDEEKIKECIEDTNNNLDNEQDKKKEEQNLDNKVDNHDSEKEKNEYSENLDLLSAKTEIKAFYPPVSTVFNNDEQIETIQDNLEQQPQQINDSTKSNEKQPEHIFNVASSSILKEVDAVKQITDSNFETTKIDVNEECSQTTTGDDSQAQLTNVIEKEKELDDNSNKTESNQQGEHKAEENEEDDKKQNTERPRRGRRAKTRKFSDSLINLPLYESSFAESNISQRNKNKANALEKVRRSGRTANNTESNSNTTTEDVNELHNAEISGDEHLKILSEEESITEKGEPKKKRGRKKKHSGETKINENELHKTKITLPLTNPPVLIANVEQKKANSDPNYDVFEFRDSDEDDTPTLPLEPIHVSSNIKVVEAKQSTQVQQSQPATPLQIQQNVHQAIQPTHHHHHHHFHHHSHHQVNPLPTINEKESDKVSKPDDTLSNNTKSEGDVSSKEYVTTSNSQHGKISITIRLHQKDGQDGGSGIAEVVKTSKALSEDKCSKVSSVSENESSTNQDSSNLKAVRKSPRLRSQPSKSTIDEVIEDVIKGSANDIRTSRRLMRSSRKSEEFIESDDDVLSESKQEHLSDYDSKNDPKGSLRSFRITRSSTRSSNGGENDINDISSTTSVSAISVTTTTTTTSSLASLTTETTTTTTTNTNNPLTTQSSENILQKKPTYPVFKVEIPKMAQPVKTQLEKRTTDYVSVIEPSKIKSTNENEEPESCASPAALVDPVTGILTPVKKQTTSSTVLPPQQPVQLQPTLINPIQNQAPPTIQVQSQQQITNVTTSQAQQISLPNPMVNIKTQAHQQLPHQIAQPIKQHHLQSILNRNLSPQSSIQIAPQPLPNEVSVVQKHIEKPITSNISVPLSQTPNTVSQTVIQEPTRQQTPIVEKSQTSCVPLKLKTGKGFNIGGDKNATISAFYNPSQNIRPEKTEIQTTTPLTQTTITAPKPAIQQYLSQHKIQLEAENKDIKREIDKKLQESNEPLKPIHFMSCENLQQQQNPMVSKFGLESKQSSIPASVVTSVVQTPNQIIKNEHKMLPTSKPSVKTIGVFENTRMPTITPGPIISDLTMNPQNLSQKRDTLINQPLSQSHSNIEQSLEQKLHQHQKISATPPSTPTPPNLAGLHPIRQPNQSSLIMPPHLGLHPTDLSAYVHQQMIYAAAHPAYAAMHPEIRAQQEAQARAVAAMRLGYPPGFPLQINPEMKSMQQISQEKEVQRYHEEKPKSHKSKQDSDESGRSSLEHLRAVSDEIEMKRHMEPMTMHPPPPPPPLSSLRITPGLPFPPIRQLPPHLLSPHERLTESPYHRGIPTPSSVQLQHQHLIKAEDANKHQVSMKMNEDRNDQKILPQHPKQFSGNELMNRQQNIFGIPPAGSPAPGYIGPQVAHSPGSINYRKEHLTSQQQHQQQASNELDLHRKIRSSYTHKSHSPSPLSINPNISCPQNMIPAHSQSLNLSSMHDENIIRRNMFSTMGSEAPLPHGPPPAHAMSQPQNIHPQTPPHATQVPPQGDSLLLQRYPVMWQGLLALKNDQAAVQMHFVSGSPRIAHSSLPPVMVEGGTPPVRIAQRMRLEQAQLEGVARKMQMVDEHCILLALPCGRDHMDVLQQSNNLKNGFINYLQSKQAAGIVNSNAPGSQQPAYVIHIFPSCEFSNENLARIAPDLLHSISEIAHLLIIIATV